MAIRQLGESLGLPPGIVAGNLGELRARGQVRRVDGEGAIVRYEITAAGVIRARKKPVSKDSRVHARVVTWTPTASPATATCSRCGSAPPRRSRRTSRVTPFLRARM
jgi:hypothetical protein